MRNFLPILGLALVLAGCSTKPSTQKPTRLPDYHALFEDQAKKDRDVLAAAHEAEKTAPEVAPQVRAIEQAVASAPASDIKKATAAYEEIVRKLTSRAEAAEKRAGEAEDKFSRWIRGGLFGLGSLVFAAGIAVAVLGSKVPMFGPVAGGAVAAGGVGIFSMAVVYDFVVKHPYIAFSGVAGCFLIAATLFLANLRNERKD
jgi:hypothetical protein